MVSTGNLMADQILALVKNRETVSFMELEREIDGFKGGDYEWILDPWNIVLWAGMTKEAIDAMLLLREKHLIHPTATTLLVYMIDGGMPRLPLAKRKVVYKKPHWIPVVFNPGPDPKSKHAKRAL
jgi:hypothetical protein